MSWWRLTLRVPRDREEDLAVALWDLGTAGLEVREGDGGRVDLDAYFAERAPAGLEPATWSPYGAELVASAALPSIDWLARYRELAPPFTVGSGFVVDPRDPGSAAPAAVPPGRTLLRVPARTAFGIGSHESTRLALELLESAALTGRDVLDLGTGTGILALAALRLGARTVVGIDADPGAALVAGDTARLNGLRPRLAGATLEALRQVPCFDLAVVNIIPAEWLAVAPALVARLRRPADPLVSGLLFGQRSLVRDRLGGLGFRLEAERRDGEWLGLALARR